MSSAPKNKRKSEDDLRAIKIKKIEVLQTEKDLEHAYLMEQLEKIAIFLDAKVRPSENDYEIFSFPYVSQFAHMSNKTVEYILCLEKDRLYLTYDCCTAIDCWMVRPEMGGYFNPLSISHDVSPDDPDESDNEAEQSMLKNVFEGQQLVSDEILEKLRQCEKKFRLLFGFDSILDKKKYRYKRVTEILSKKYCSPVPE